MKRGGQGALPPSSPALSLVRSRAKDVPSGVRAEVHLCLVHISSVSSESGFTSESVCPHTKQRSRHQARQEVVGIRDLRVPSTSSLSVNGDPTCKGRAARLLPREGEAVDRVTSGVAWVGKRRMHTGLPPMRDNDGFAFELP